MAYAVLKTKCAVDLDAAPRERCAAEGSARRLRAAWRTANATGRIAKVALMEIAWVALLKSIVSKDLVVLKIECAATQRRAAEKEAVASMESVVQTTKYN
jgi:hypothetical protein